MLERVAESRRLASAEKKICSSNVSDEVGCQPR